MPISLTADPSTDPDVIADSHSDVGGQRKKPVHSKGHTTDTARSVECQIEAL